MTSSVPSIVELFRPLIGLPCWNVKQGYGSFLTFEFGEPSLATREPRDIPHASSRVREVFARRLVTVHGQWHLWIYCCGWQIRLRGEGLADDESSDDKIAAACGALDGQALQQVTLGPYVGWTQFHFDLGGMLTTRPYEDELEEKWMLYCRDGNVYTYRSDGTASFGPGTRKPHEEQWDSCDQQVLSADGLRPAAEACRSNNKEMK